ncbi:single-stranded-DNA-specific exonuclease RecJ [Andreesenia angusta]|uniref:Single-stranded-DNA-specific exonuclease RecJ n=1 Tax=Andreesenia angusta TaxID=39480 RepID=A0A1S1V7Y0_9FIRM|nr:single-stranded-DNA-specific exonuclease RecJ [Andreesenia angusta]OHW62604.1 single-stranded-DNA-specific exonuclease RecJ [Andreesenia angusta]
MKKWIIKNTKADLDRLSKALGQSKLICKVVSNRGFTEVGEIEHFLNPSLENLHSPWRIKDMETAVSLLERGIECGKHIRVVGDYDQDGISSTVILVRGLMKLGAKVSYDIPERTRDGYGINKRIIDAAAADGVDIIITCDNGISAAEEVGYAKSLGIDVVVTDHHDVPYVETPEGMKEYRLPPADAVLNPKRHDCSYPFDGLCGAGVSFKLVQSLYEKRGFGAREMDEFYGFLALATVCDVMDLIGENRIFVKEGLQKLRDSSNLGLKSLIEETGLSGKALGTYHLGFVLGPCINASGRLETAKTAVELFLTSDRAEAEGKARTLKSLNEERKELTQAGIDRIMERIEKNGTAHDKVIVAVDREVQESIAGIIAGRIKEKYNRPSIVVTASKEEGLLKGSGRSIEEYNMFEEMSKHKELFEKFGGHPMAAGFSIPEENLDELGYRLNRDSELTEEDFVPKIYLDAHVPLDKIDISLPESLEILEPFGKGNSRPLFGDRGLKVRKMDLLGSSYRIFKFRLEKGDRAVEAVYFGDIEEMRNYLDSKFGTEEVENALRGAENELELDLVYYPSVNEFNGRRNLQIVIQDYR